MLKTLQPGLNPLGQFDGLDAEVLTLLGGEVVSFKSVLQQLQLTKLQKMYLTDILMLLRQNEQLYHVISPLQLVHSCLLMMVLPVTELFSVLL